MTDLDVLLACPDCLHERSVHGCDGCRARDALGNRCACVQDAS